MTQYKLTTPQKNIWNLQKFYENTSISNICGAVLFDEKYDSKLLEQAVNEEIRLQDGMRIRFCDNNGKMVQYTHNYSYEKFDFMEFNSSDEFNRFGEEYANKLFELLDSQMYRVTVFELCGKSGVLLCASHLISDAWTYSILAKDVFYIYNLLVHGKTVDLPKYNYTDYIESEQKYFKSEKYVRDKAYWTEKYRDKPELSPIKLMRTPVFVPTAKRYTTALSAELTNKTDEFCAENGISQAVVFEAAVIAYLSRINVENKSVTIGLPVLNRNNVHEKRTVGMYISTAPLTVEISDNDSAFSLCRKITDGHRQIFRHRKYPFGDILRDIRERMDFSGNLYGVMVSCQNAKTNIKASTKWFPSGFSEIPFTFHIDNRDSSDRYTVTIDYQTEAFPQDGEISLVAERIMLIVNQIVSDKNIPLKDISILPDEEYRRIIFNFNNTAVDYPKDKCVHELFSEQAENNPYKVVLVFENEKFTYRRLDEMSNSIAHCLREKGIKPNDVVPIIAKRSPHIIVAMLGVLKSGGAYMPVSPSYPAERIEYMLETVGAKLALTFGYSCENIEEISLNSFDYSHNTEHIENLNCPDDLCYVIFTSGSTGKPKGAAVSHKNVVNYCADNDFNVCRKIIGKDARSIVSVTNFIFDIFVTESILPLLNGIKIYLTSDTQTVSQKQLGRLITDSGAEIIQTTPTKMRSYIFDKSNLEYLSVLKTIILGGEEFPMDLFEKLKKNTSAEIYNIYGPAETTVWSSFEHAQASSDISIGRPIANTHIYILDGDGKPLPIGIAGELCISGDGVGKGYINCPELTAEKFVPNPFVSGETMYHTGDLARMQVNGNIEFLGRIDAQFKIHGMRIELGEIESVMSSFEGIRLAAVMDRYSEKGRHYLAGYFISDNVIEDKALRTYLTSRLPAYMTPNYFMRLAEMPVTPSGKIDRKNLPVPDINKRSEDYAAPETETEKILCGIVSDLLGIKCVGVNDDFFELGGDSLSSIEYAANAQEMGIDLSLQSVFECRTVRELCSRIADGSDNDIQADCFDGYPAQRSKSDMRLFKMFVRFTKCFYKFEVIGSENLDVGSRYIFCPNHESDLDCMWVWTALNNFTHLNETCALIAQEHLNKTVSRKVFEIAGGIPIDRNGDFFPSMKRAQEVIVNEKSCILVHPEGTRTRRGELGKFKCGAAVLSIDSGIKIVPVCVNGAHDIFPPCKKFPRIFNFRKFKKYSLQIKFGVPIEPVGKGAERITDEIRKQIIEMKMEDKNDNRN